MKISSPIFKQFERKLIFESNFRRHDRIFNIMHNFPLLFMTFTSGGKGHNDFSHNAALFKMLRADYHKKEAQLVFIDHTKYQLFNL